jgi:hypothetical protein
MKTKQSYYKKDRYKETLCQIQTAKLKNLAKIDIKKFANMLSFMIKKSK